MSVIDSLRRPEHIGENHCLPCTVVNVALVVAAGLAVSALSPVADLVVPVDGALSVYLRGYVVPGTFSFASQLVNAVGLAGVFDHGGDAPDRRSGSLDANVDSDVMLSMLLNTGVLVEEEDGLFLAADACEEWESTTATLRKATDEKLVETVANTAPLKAAADVGFGDIPLDGPSMSVWISRPRVIADVATPYTVVERGVDPMAVLVTTEPMQVFVEICLDCGGLVEETTTRNCCGGTTGLYGSPERGVFDCAGCGAVVYESPDE